MKNRYQTLTRVKNRYLCEKLVSNHQMWKIGTKLSHMWRTGTRSSQMSVTKLWRIGIECKMQQIWGVFYQCGEYACMLFEIWICAYFNKVRDIGTKYVTYWYQFFTCCEYLVPILHSVKLTKCGICGSTKHTCSGGEHFYFVYVCMIADVIPNNHIKPSQNRVINSVLTK